MSLATASEESLEYRLAEERQKRFKWHELVLAVLKRGVVSVHWYSAALLTSFLQVGLDFLTPIPAAIIVGSILPMVVDLQESSHALISVCLAWALLQVFWIAVSLLYEYLATEGSYNLILKLRRVFLGDLELVSEESRENLGEGRLYTTYSSDLPAYSQFYADFVPTLLTNIVNVLATFTIIYLLSRPIFFVLLLVLPLQILVSSFFSSRMGTLYRRFNRLRDDAMSMFNESLHNSDLIKSFDAVDRMTDRTVGKVEAMIEQARLTRNRSILWMACGRGVHFSFTIGIALIAGLQVIEGALSLTFYLVINAYALRVLGPIQQLIQLVQRIIPLMVSVQWSEEFFRTAANEESDPRPEHLPIQGHEIEFRNVTFRYPDTPETAHPALDAISFRVPRGQMTVLCGPSGCGKSAVLKLLRGNLEAQQGQVLLGGRDVRHLDRKNLSHLMAYLPQRISLLSMSILQNAQLLAPGSGEEELKKTLKMARILEELEEMEQEVRVEVDDRGATPFQRLGRMIFGSAPRRIELMERREGLDRLAGQTGNLSGGQQQRVSVAFALLANCPVLLFDEPTAGLDKFAENGLVEMVASLADQDRTVVVVAHTLSPYFALPDEKVSFVFLDNGRLLGAGQRRELLATCPEFRALARENVRHALALDHVDLDLLSAEGEAG